MSTASIHSHWHCQNRLVALPSLSLTLRSAWCHEKYFIYIQ